MSTIRALARLRQHRRHTVSVAAQPIDYEATPARRIDPDRVVFAVCVVLALITSLLVMAGVI